VSTVFDETECLPV